MTRLSLASLVVVSLLISACGASAPVATIPPIESPTPGGDSSPTIVPSPCEAAGAVNLAGLPGRFPPLTPVTTYWVDPDRDFPAGPCAIFEVPAEGWNAFLGPYKDCEKDGQLVERVSALITDVTNLTVDGCTDHRRLDPRVGPSVDDLATALTELPPFEVASPPVDVTMYGYSGQHLQLRVPEDMPHASASGRFEDCSNGSLETWIAPGLGFAFYGYTGPGDTEDFWILDVDGTRIVVIALTSPGASEELIAERQVVLDSIVIEP
jgi:hypothetical protein